MDVYFKLSRKWQSWKSCLSGADPITDSYKSLVTLINKTSNDFKDGKKWKCNDYCGRKGVKKLEQSYPKSWKDFERVMFAPPAKKDRSANCAKTNEESQTSAIVGKPRQDLLHFLFKSCWVKLKKEVKWQTWNWEWEKPTEGQMIVLGILQVKGLPDPEAKQLLKCSKSHGFKEKHFLSFFCIVWAWVSSKYSE